MLDFALLRNFAIVARSGSISVASSQIGRTQSALSMQMQRLEQVIGEPLLAKHDEIRVDMCGTGLKGSISFGCPEDYSIAFLPGPLRGFCAHYPAIELRMVCALTLELRPMLHRRQIELALVSLPDPVAREVIRSEDLVWVANAPEPDVLGQAILPLALSAPMILDYRAACDAMDAVDAATGSPLPATALPASSPLPAPATPLAC